MRFEQILISTSLLCFSWSSAALAQLKGVADGQILTQSVSDEDNLIQNVPRLATDTFLAPPRIKVLPDIPPLIRGARACFQTLYLPVYCEEDPPQPPLKRGENQVLVPLFKGDLGGSPGLKTRPSGVKGDEGVKSVASKNEIDITHSAIGEGRGGQWVSPANKQQLGQNAPTIPPGTIEPTRPTLPLPTTPPQTPTSLPPLTAPNQIPGTPPPELGVKVKVQRVEVLGSTAFSPAELDAAVAPFIGKEATFEDLLEIRAAITKLYTDNGYTTSGAFLPPQDVTEGVVKVQVVEGAIEKIDIQGLRRLRTSYVRSRLDLVTKAPVNIRRLEEALQLLQLNPLISNVQAELSSGTTPGLSVLTLKMKEAQPLSAALLVENRDSPSVGSIRGTASISHNNLLGFGDRLSADYGISKGINSYNISYQLPVNARDGTLSVSYNNNSSKIIEEPFSPLDINADSYTLSFGFRQPLVRTPTSEFALGLALDLRQSQTYILENIPFSFSPGPENGKSKISALRFSQDWINRSATRVLAARSQFSVGLDAFDATVNNTGIDGRFFSWVGQFQWVQALGGGTILIARTGAQLTPDSLLPIEQFSIGGIDTVRGYRQNQRVADNGIVGSVEVRFPIVGKPSGIGTIQLAPFFDIGTAWNHKGDIPSPTTLASVGLGLLWQLDPYLSARLDWGIPLISIKKQGESLQDNGLFFSLRFQPF